MVQFAAPAALILLFMPFLARLLLSPRQAAADAMRVPPSIAACMTGAPHVTHQARLYRALPFVIWVSLVLALSGPQRLETLDARPASGRDIVLALDLSGSMEKEDFALDGRTVSRLDAVKAVAGKFVISREGDRIGLVVFADRPFFAAPLTFDVRAVARTIEEATIGISGRSTAISDGLGLALKRLMQSAARSRVIILLSDGADTKATVAPQAVADIAAENDIRVHTIAMGPQDLETAPGADDAVDTTTLGEISAASGGTLFRVRNMSDLEAVTAAINTLEPSPTTAPPVQYWREFWIWPASLCLVAAILLVVGSRRFGG